MSARMGWNPEAPTNGLRVTLLAYLEARRRDRVATLERPPSCGCDLWQRGYCRGGCPSEMANLPDDSQAARAEIRALRRWIHWLEGREISDVDLARADAATSGSEEIPPR